MQNNVTDLIQKLQRSLDNNYNVIDMPAVIEIISTLEKTAVTKELLETTRLGRYINGLRRRTSNESLAKRAKDLLKKWRDLILPDANGQIKAGGADTGQPPPAAERSSRKRPAAGAALTDQYGKRPLLNGQSRELDFSDNSNCSVKDLQKTDVICINSDSNSSMPDQTVDSVCSSHSNDPLDAADASSPAAGAQPKKRGRKKGSKNHKNLVIAAEESFSNKMAVSRNSKVKTTQELLADLQNRTVSASRTASSHQDIELRAAQLTESLSRIDQKLNPQKQINKNVTPIRNDRAAPPNSLTKTAPHRTALENWSSRSSPEVVMVQSDDEIVDVVGTDPPSTGVSSASVKQEEQPDAAAPPEPLTISSLLSQLPPVDPSCLEEMDGVPLCECPLPPVVDLAAQDRITVQIVGNETLEPLEPLKDTSIFASNSPVSFSAKQEEEEDEEVKKEVVEDVAVAGGEDGVEGCPAKVYLRGKYKLEAEPSGKVLELRDRCLVNVNGNWGRCGGEARAGAMRDGLYVDIVPSLTTLAPERPGGAQSASGRARDAASENFQKYSISIAGDQQATAPAHDPNMDADADSVKWLQCCDNNKGGGAAPRRTEEQNGESDQSEFREWHETLDVQSYNGETLRVLPYVIID